MRLTLASMAAPGTDIILTEERILSYRAFANKIWNAADSCFSIWTSTKPPASGTEVLHPRTCARPPLLQWKVKSRSWTDGFLAPARTNAQVNDALENFVFMKRARSCIFFWAIFATGTSNGEARTNFDGRKKRRLPG